MLWCNQLLLEFLLPLSYSHLLLSATLDRLPFTGVGVGGPSPKKLEAVLAPKLEAVLAPKFEAVLAPSALPEPNDDLRPAPPAIAFCSNGLTGEYCNCDAMSFVGELLLHLDGE